MQALNERVIRAARQKKLFADCQFSLQRESPISILQHLILSFGGSFVIQDKLNDLDEAEAAKVYKKLTHIVMDRPLAPAKATQFKTKEVVQPQYIVDALNNLLLLPTRPYKPGVPAPSHLSPFVDNEAAGYVPDRQREINTLAGVATPAAAEESESDSDDEEDEEDQAEDKEMKGDADSSSDEESSEKQVKPKKKVSAAKIKKELQEEANELGKMLMTKRQRKLY
jgi:pescadillo protein